MGGFFVLGNHIIIIIIMFILFISIFLFLFLFIFISINKKRWKSVQASAIISKGLCPSVFRFQIRQHISSSKEHISDDNNTKATKPLGKQQNVHLRDLSLEDDTRSESTTSTPSARKSSSMKINCLCAPTTHPGSFRCRYHRTSASVGSNLSDLANRRTASVGANLYQLGNTTSTKQPKRSKEC